MDRRKLIATAAATFAATLSEHARAYKGSVEDFIVSPDFQKRHATRFVELDTEALMDFLGGYMRMQQEYGGVNAHPERVAFLKARGYPLGPVDLSWQECHDIMMQAPHYAAYVRTSRTVHEQMWAWAMDSILKHEDLYLSAMEATDKSGPGSLEMNMGMTIPEYCLHEIHEQPGGYCGNPFAGMLYHYATVTSFYQGLAPGTVVHDERNALMVARYPTPPDGKLKRILELGCSDGRSTIALKERFPDAEVWGIDIGAPQVRYAHHRAAHMGIDVHFAQRLGEDSKFPDNYFDMITVNAVFHEVAAFATKNVVPEMARITRPGGIWIGDGSGTGGDYKFPGTIIAKAAIWVNHRYNNEVWEVQNHSHIWPELRKASGWGTDLSTGKPIAVKV